MLLILFVRSSYLDRVSPSFKGQPTGYPTDYTLSGNHVLSANNEISKKFPPTINPGLTVNQQEDPKKKTGDQTTNPPPKVKKDNLWQALLKFLKLKKNANKKLDIKVLAAIQKLGLKDSIAATAQNVRFMVAELKKKKYQDLDSLQAVLSMVVKKQQEEDIAKSEVLPAGSVSPSPVDLAALTNQLIPLMDQKIGEEKYNKEKNEKLRIINRVKNADPKTIYEVKVSDSVVRKYTLKLKNKAEVYGFFDAAYPAGADAFFNAATSLIYYAIPVNETTGNFDQLNHWDTSPVIDKAEKKGTKVYFTLLIANKAKNSALLYNLPAQKRCIGTVVELLKKRRASGVNISFKYLSVKDKPRFSEFVGLIHQALQAADSSYKILITLPRTNFDGAYELEELNKYTDRFFIDFATNTARAGAALAPLTGKGHETIDASFTWYSAHGITADKLVVILPYRGANCYTDPIMPSADYFAGYLPFTEIQRMTQSRVNYSEENQSAYIDTVYHDLRSYRIWFDNEMTLSKKYDYILKNNVGGVGLYYINYDDPFNALNDELVYKFTEVDTTYLKPVNVSIPELSFLQKLKRHAILWNFILQNPCATCFENSATATGGNAMIRTYLKDLKIYALIKIQKSKVKRARRNNSVKSDDVRVNDVFNYMNQELNTVLKYTSLLFLFFAFCFIAFYIWGIRFYGGDWPYRKVVAGTLVVIISLFVLFGFTFCFTSDLIPLFGVSALSSNSLDCVTDPKCINIPFNTLLLIIFISILLGFLIFRYLITPLIKRDDLP